MRGLEKIAWEGDKQTDRQTHTRTCQLLDQLGPEGRVGEKSVIDGEGKDGQARPGPCRVRESPPGPRDPAYRGARVL